MADLFRVDYIARLKALIKGATPKQIEPLHKGQHATGGPSLGWGHLSDGAQENALEKGDYRQAKSTNKVGLTDRRV